MKKPLPNFDLELQFSKKFDLIIGIDEVGRGAIAGPLTVCGLAIKKHLYHKLDLFQKLNINDSKLLSSKQRKKIVKNTREILFSKKIISISNKIIDKEGISRSFLKAVEQIEEFYIKKFPSQRILLLIDYYPYTPRYKNVASISIKRGDRISFTIALASIYAKVKRDNFMKNLHEKLPFYNWIKNKGYGTAEHFALTKKHGFSDFHRKTFLKNLVLKKNNSTDKI